MIDSKKREDLKGLRHAVKFVRLDNADANVRGAKVVEALDLEITFEFTPEKSPQFNEMTVDS